MTKRLYDVSALVTISIYQKVWANSKREALRKAEGLSMPSIHTPDDGIDWGEPDEDEQAETWSTSGELDGEAFDITAEEA